MPSDSRNASNASTDIETDARFSNDQCGALDRRARFPSRSRRKSPRPRIDDGRASTRSSALTASTADPTPSGFPSQIQVAAPLHCRILVTAWWRKYRAVNNLQEPFQSRLPSRGECAATLTDSLTALLAPACRRAFYQLINRGDVSGNDRLPGQLSLASTTT